MSHDRVTYRGRVKYDDATAQKYQVRKEGKDRAEMRLVDRVFARIPKSHRVLDVPCGGGRVTVHLAHQGYTMAAADLSDAMLKLARQHTANRGVACPIEKQDIEKLAYPDRHFDAVVSFRLFHHFPNREVRARVVKELCRVARQYVALSYFSPLSVTSVKRAMRSALGGKKSDKHATSLAEVKVYFAEAGFRLVKDYAQAFLLHTLHLALFERAPEGKP